MVRRKTHLKQQNSGWRRTMDSVSPAHRVEMMLYFTVRRSGSQMRVGLKAMLS